LNFIFGLNMFLVPIKLETFKFSPYLILIGFLVLTKKITFNFSLCYNKVCLIILKLLNFLTIFLKQVYNTMKSSFTKI